ncbi:hypothetical protein M0804_013380 [Polistes exclamans]|nr:hypothetical protein M0804_013380 [Polistes exclamans]
MDSSLATMVQNIELLKKFDPEYMIFLVWQNSFEYVVDLLKVPDYEKSNFLLTMLENSAIEIIRKKVGHVNLSNLPYDKVTSILEGIFSYYREDFAARYRFDGRDQILGESAKQYSEVLSKLIIKCNYGSKTYYNLICRFIKGLRNKRAQFTILKMEVSSFREAVEMAERIESLETLTQQGDSALVLTLTLVNV